MSPGDVAALEPGDVLGRPFWDTYWWSHDPQVRADLRAAVDRAAAGEACRYDVWVRVAEGRLLPIDFQRSWIIGDSIRDLQAGIAVGAGAPRDARASAAGCPPPVAVR